MTFLLGHISKTTNSKSASSRASVVLITVTVLAAFLSPSNSGASTFVGNGGNAGDVEWLVSLNQIDLTLKWVEGLDTKGLCVCTETYANHKTCDLLNSLSQTQIKFCQDTLTKQLPMLRELVSSSNRVRVAWTNESIEVRENGRLRAVDAVTDRMQNKITMDPDKFRALTPNERIFLITHELFHLTDLDQKPMEDVGAIGPFTDKDGGRDLINAMAATLTVQSTEQNIPSTYRGALKRPQGWRTNWVDLNYGFTQQSGDSTFEIEEYDTVELLYRKYFGAFGVYGGFRSQTGEKTILTQIKGSERIETWSVGVTYRYFPFSNPLTFFGQSHLILMAGADFMNGKYTVEDPSIGGSGRTKSTGFSANVGYAIPLFARFWGRANVAYQKLPGNYEIENVLIESEESAVTATLGVSYAF